VQIKQGLSQLDKKIVGTLLIALIVIVLTASLSYFLLGQPNQTPNNHSPTPTPSPEPTQSPTATPTPKPAGDEPANLTINVEELNFRTDSGLVLLIKGNITNTGDQTAYNVKLHIQTWFPNGTKGMDKTTETLNRQTLWLLPFAAVNITGGDWYRLNNRWFPDNLVVSVPREFWLDTDGYVYPYDLISSYVITPLWDDAP
jgi:hypothetical protein